jgi:5-methylcytosine-specific restriction endonuclease McrA
MKRKWKEGILKIRKGIKSPYFKNWISNKRNICIDCGKVLGKSSYYANIKRCKRCANLGNNNPRAGKLVTKKTRIKMSLSHGGTGIPYESYDYPRIFFKIRETIRKKYHYICQVCGKFGKVVHHIDYDKWNCVEYNLTNLCQKCNLKANFNKDYWYAYFTYLMERK